MHIPVFFNPYIAIAPDERMTGKQSLDAAKERLVIARRMIRQIIRERAVIKLRLDGARGEDRFNFRSEIERAIIRLSIIKRLHAQTVARDKEFMLALVPDGEGEHAPQAFNARRPVLFIKMNDCFRVAVRLIDVPARFQFLTKIRVVVDFAVVSDVQCAVFVGHRLMPRRHVND